MNRPAPRAVRLLARALAPASLLLVAGLLLAPPASAEPAVGWPEAEPVSLLHALLLIGGISLGVLLVITVVTLGPGIARGEGIAPGVSPVEDQWLGGPDDSPKALASGRRDASAEDQGGKPLEIGGASARW